MPSFSATRAACSGAAPPNAIRVRGAQVLAALDGVHARRVRHVLVDHLADAERRVLGRKIERRADPLGDRALGAVDVERHAAARERRRIDAAEHEIGVGHGRLAAAAAVADRAGLRAGAVGPDRDASERVDPRDRAAAGADLDHLDHRNAQRQAAALEEAIDARHLEARARSAAAPCRSGRSSRWCRPCRRTAPGRARAGARCSRRRSRRPPGRIRPGAPESGSRSRPW